MLLFLLGLFRDVENPSTLCGQLVQEEKDQRAGEIERKGCVGKYNLVS